MKRLVCFLFLILLLGNLAIVSSETIPQLDAAASKASDIKDSIGDLKNVNSQAYWEQKVGYLGVEFPKLLLKNPFISKVDSFFQKISLVFRILFGMSYSLSLTLLFVIAFWVFFWISFSKFIGSLGNLKGGINFLLGAMIVIVLAQIGFFKSFVIRIGNLIFAPKYTWLRVIILVAFILAFIGLSYLEKKVLALLKKTKISETVKGVENYQKALIAREEERARASNIVK